MFDKDAIEARRNPLNKSQADKKKKEMADSTKRPDQVYGFFADFNGVERCFYIGVSINPEVRFAQHRRAIGLGLDPKPAYDQARQLGLENVKMTVIDPDGEFTEAEWETIYIEQGHPICNVDGKTVGNKRKKRVNYEHAAALKGSPDAGPLVIPQEVQTSLDKLLAATIEKGNVWANSHYKK